MKTYECTGEPPGGDKNDSDAIHPDFPELEQIVCQSISMGVHTSIQELVATYLHGESASRDTYARVSAIAIERGIENNRLRNKISQAITNTLIPLQEGIDGSNKISYAMEVSKDGIILNVNKYICKISGFSERELVGKNMKIMNSGIHSPEFWKGFWETILSGKIWTGDICNKRKDGSHFWLWTIVLPRIDIHGDIRGFRVMRQDVSESYSEERLLCEKAHTKEGTIGLPSHIACLEDFKENSNRSLTLFHINNMADINNAYGREVGNLVIKRVSYILKCVCLEYTHLDIKLYKFEGTDFALVFTHDIDRSTILKMYERLNSAIFSRGSVHIHLSFSAGTVMNESNIEILIRRSHRALQYSKQERICIILDETEERHEDSQEFFRIQNLIREAWKENLFVVYIQEIRDCQKQTETQSRKYECLIRMQESKERNTTLLPSKFLPIIQKSGENRRLTLFVIERICEYMLHNEHSFSVNLTADDLYSTKNIEKLHQSVRRFGISPSRITFEILEDINVLENPILLRNIKLLKGYGFKLAIDDFGTHHANFSSILFIEPDVIKIDTKYTRGIDKNRKHASLVRAIVTFAHENNIQVIAEGVETESEATALRMLQIDYLQGWLFDTPQPIQSAL